MVSIAPPPDHRPSPAEFAAAEACARKIAAMPSAGISYEGRVAFVLAALFVAFCVVLVLK